MSQNPTRLPLSSTSYVTKINGKLVTVRTKQPPSLFDAGLDLMREVFHPRSTAKAKMNRQSKKASGENVSPQPPILSHPPFNPNANLRGPTTPQGFMGPLGAVGPMGAITPYMTQLGTFQYGNRQLALLPLSPPGLPQGPLLMPQQSLVPFMQAPWAYTQSPNMGGYNFPPMGIDPRQFITNPAPNTVAAPPVTATVGVHVCAHCSRPRSRKYHKANPLKPGEVSVPGFCGKCQKDTTSSEAEDSDSEKPKKHKTKTKKRRLKDTKSDKVCSCGN